jgi:hypothetical protein
MATSMLRPSVFVPAPPEDKRVRGRIRLPANGRCPTTHLYHFECRCNLHRCGYCGRRTDQQAPLFQYMCQCARNRRDNRRLAAQVTRLEPASESV